jgi:hypothetical protein
MGVRELRLRLCAGAPSEFAAANALKDAEISGEEVRPMQPEDPLRVCLANGEPVSSFGVLGAGDNDIGESLPLPPLLPLNNFIETWLLLVSQFLHC